MKKPIFVFLMLTLTSFVQAAPQDSLGQILVDKDDEALYVECLESATDGSCVKFSFVHHDPSKSGERAFKLLSGEGVSKDQISKLSAEVKCRNKEQIGEFLGFVRQTVRDRQRDFKTPLASVNLYRDDNKGAAATVVTILKTPLVFALEDVAFYTLGPIIESGVYAVKSIGTKIKSLRQKPLLERLLDQKQKGVVKKIGRARLRRMIESLSDLLKFKSCKAPLNTDPV